MDIDLFSQKGYNSSIDNIIQEFEREKLVPLKRISNEIVEYCATRTDDKGVYLAVMAYILYKTISQTHIVASKTWKKDKEIILSFFTNLKTFKKDDLRNQLNKFIILFQNKDVELYNYIKNIEKKGRVKVGARLYSMGYTTTKVSEILQVNNFELQKYLVDTQAYNQRLSENLLSSKVQLLLKENKHLIFDSSSLISIGNTGLINFFEEFKKKNPKVNLYITESVHNETIDIKEKVVRYGWIGIQYQYLIQKGIFTVIKQDKITQNSTIENLCNTIFYTKHGKLELLQKGELESVIFAQKNNCVLVIDEIITRWLIESPTKLHKLLESRYKEKVLLDKNKLSEANKLIKSVPVVRSVDFMGFAIKQGYFNKFEGLNYIKPLLYSLKYSGCATTYEEIDSYVGKGVDKYVRK